MEKLKRLFEKTNNQQDKNSANEWLEKNYPKNGVCRDYDRYENIGKKRSEIIVLNVYEKELVGTLDVSSFPNLEELKCWNNQLTSLILPKNNQLSKIRIFNNYLTTFDYACLNPLTLKELEIFNNNLAATDIEVFSSFVNLINLAIGNEKAWINKGNQGNQFTGSFASFQGLTKLATLHIKNLPLQPELEYLPTSLQGNSLNDQIYKELHFNHNLSFWKLINNELIIEKSQQNIDYSNIKPQILIDTPNIYKDKITESVIINYNLNNLDYSKFFLLDRRPFNWTISNAKQLPLRLYNLTTNQVENSNSLPDNTNYLILSYCWGTDWEKTPQSYGQDYPTDLTKLGRKALNKVLATWKLLKEQHQLDINHIWIDNFCINQNKKEEKGQEVAKQQIYYGNATATLISIDAEIGNLNEESEYQIPRHCLEKVAQSPWFTRSWCFQEGILSKQTIFMFDDVLVDGRKLAQTWNALKRREEIIGKFVKKKKDSQGWEIIVEEIIPDKDKKNYQSPQIHITPVGWSYGAIKQHSVNLTLWEALLGLKHRSQTVAVDRIYSVLGLLPYGDKVKVNYQPFDYQYTQKELDDQLVDVIFTAIQNGYGAETLLTWSGHGNTLTFQELVKDNSLEVKESSSGEELVTSVEQLEIKY